MREGERERLAPKAKEGSTICHKILLYLQVVAKEWRNIPFILQQKNFLGGGWVGHFMTAGTPSTALCKNESNFKQFFSSKEKMVVYNKIIRWPMHVPYHQNPLDFSFLFYSVAIKTLFKMFMALLHEFLWQYCMRI